MLGNLPVHPMLVHFAVVLILATGLLQLGALTLPRMGRWLGWALPALGVLTAVMTKLTESFGEDLEHRMPRTQLIHDHAEWGDKAGAAALALGLVTVLQWLATTDLPWAERKLGFLRGRGARIAIAVVTGLVCVAAIVLDVLAGHSGATAVWSGH